MKINSIDDLPIFFEVFHNQASIDTISIPIVKFYGIWYDDSLKLAFTKFCNNYLAQTNSTTSYFSILTLPIEVLRNEVFDEIDDVEMFKKLKVYKLWNDEEPTEI